jgi:signal transduction histidine kinase
MLTLRFHQEEHEIITELADNGPGIVPEMANRLFQPFASQGKPHGSGLGLSICKKIIEDHGGRIWAANDPQGGAVFSFALPLAG